jgi:uncharacterized protein
MSLEVIIKRILLSLKGCNIQKVILFGSYAYGHPDKNSDIDLLVVTTDQYIPETFKEKMDLKVDISRKLNRIRNNFPVDLIVHTVPMHERFIQLDSLFKKEVLTKGKVIYERNSN